MATKEKFVVLDGLRGIAALMVLTRHIPAFFSSISNVETFRSANNLVGPFSSSYLAVDFFFCLSGFVIAHSSEGKLTSGRMSTWEFMLHRLIRLYPLYFLSMAVTFLALHVPSHVETWPTVGRMRSVFMTLGFPTRTLSPYLYVFNVPAWSLFFEIIANLAYSSVLVWCRSRTLVGFSVAAACLLTAAVSRQWFELGMPGSGALDSGFQWLGFGAGMLRVAFSFSVGVMISRVRLDYPMQLSVHPALLVIGLFALLAMPIVPAWQAEYALLTVFVVFPSVVFLGSYSMASEKVLRVFAWGGGISYAVYVLQEPLYNLAIGLMPSVAMTAHQQVSCGVVFMCGVVAVATVANRADRPVREWLRMRCSAIASWQTQPVSR